MGTQETDVKKEKGEREELTAEERFKRKLRKDFRFASNRLIDGEYDGAFSRPEFFRLEDGSEVTYLRCCHRSLGVVEGKVLSFIREEDQGILGIGEDEFPFCLHVTKGNRPDFEELLGQTLRFSFRPIIPGIPPLDGEVETKLPKLRLVKPRSIPEPETNYVEVMGRLHQLRDDGFVLIAWDFYAKEYCHIPFADPYPFPDEDGEFVWVKGRFEPATSSLRLEESQSIFFFEREEAIKIKEQLKKKKSIAKENKKIEETPEEKQNK